MFDAVILGIIQGITEFIPISSSAHLELAQYFLNFKVPNSISFTIALHLGTLFAVLIVFFKDIKNICIGFLKGLKNVKTSWYNNTEFKTGILIIIATVPATIVGLLIHKYIDMISFSKIGTNLFICGSILLATRLYDKKNTDKKEIKDIEIWMAVAIGIAQSAAIFPGISRSGMTISIALFLGIARKDAGVFSFLLSIPVILGAFILEIKSITNIDLSIIIPGFLAAFISGLIALNILMNFLKKGKLFYFGFYCMIVGFGVYLYFFML